MRHLQSTFNLVQDAQQCGGEILRGVESASGAGASGPSWTSISFGALFGQTMKPSSALFADQHLLDLQISCYEKAQNQLMSAFIGSLEVKRPAHQIKVEMSPTLKTTVPYFQSTTTQQSGRFSSHSSSVTVAMRQRRQVIAP